MQEGRSEGGREGGGEGGEGGEEKGALGEEGGSQIRRTRMTVPQHGREGNVAEGRQALLGDVGEAPVVRGGVGVN